MNLLEKEPVIVVESYISSWPSFLAGARWMQSALFIQDLMWLENTTSGARTFPCIRFCQTALQTFLELSVFVSAYIAEKRSRLLFVFLQTFMLKFQMPKIATDTTSVALEIFG